MFRVGFLVEWGATFAPFSWPLLPYENHWELGIAMLYEYARPFSARFGLTRARVRLSCFVIQQVSETWEEGGGGGSSVGAQRRAQAYRRTLNLVAMLIKAARRTVWTLACVIVLYFLRTFRCRCREAGSDIRYDVTLFQNCYVKMMVAKSRASPRP